MKTVLVILALALASVSSLPHQAKSSPHPRKPRIVGGQTANPGQFPYSLKLANPDGSIFCDAVLISPTSALTSTTCLNGRLAELYAIAGMLHAGQDNPEKQEVNVVNVIPYPNYDGIYNDVLILQLEHALQFNDLVQPIALPDLDEAVSEGDNATATGWGLTNVNGGFANELQYLDMPIISNADCNQFYEQNGPYPNMVIGTQLCAQPKSRSQSLCTGDEGSPLAQNGKLVGISTENFDFYCGALYSAPVPLLYTRISFYIDFIKEHVTDL